MFDVVLKNGWVGVESLMTIGGGQTSDGSVSPDRRFRQSIVVPYRKAWSQWHVAPTTVQGASTRLG